ncbi:GNAT family N-acetyltransferase [Marininema mesophilum]|nr:GNAT family N-acetyltransferase [Marininema mesophilum]
METKRLVLGDWEPGDLALFTNLHQDPQAMKYFPKLYNEKEVAEMINRYKDHQESRGWSIFSLRLKENKQFIGCIGLLYRDFPAHFTPCVEIGWKISPMYWNQGYATEAAKKLLHKGFTDYGLTEIISFTVPQNVASRRVMEKIGLIHDKEGDFQHTRLTKDHPLSWHVLYRLTKEQYDDHKLV